MPSLKDIRRRIDSVHKTQQITRAMRMVAAAKLRRAQDAILSARPYAERMRATLAEVAGSRLDATHPLLEAREPVRARELVVITSDRGLCGGFNHNLLKRAEVEVARCEAEGLSVGLTLVGRKAVEHLRRRHPEQVTHTLTGITDVAYRHAVELAEHVSARFLAGEVDEVFVLFSEFVSALTQTPRVERLLPARPATGGEAADKPPYEIEPSPEKLLQVLVPKAVQVELLRALLESQAGEQAARMTAMESATRNTEELIERLTLQYNRARQAAITKELVEIVSGAEAL